MGGGMAGGWEERTWQCQIQSCYCFSTQKTRLSFMIRNYCGLKLLTLHKPQCPGPHSQFGYKTCFMMYCWAHKDLFSKQSLKSDLRFPICFSVFTKSFDSISPVEFSFNMSYSNVFSIWVIGMVLQSMTIVRGRQGWNILLFLLKNGKTIFQFLIKL